MRSTSVWSWNNFQYQPLSISSPFTLHKVYVLFFKKVNIWNVNCARATAFIFDTRTGVLAKVSKFLRQKMSRPEGDSNPQPSDSCRMRLTFWAITFEMLTVHGQQFMYYLYLTYNFEVFSYSTIHTISTHSVISGMSMPHKDVCAFFKM